MQSFSAWPHDSSTRLTPLDSRPSKEAFAALSAKKTHARAWMMWPGKASHCAGPTAHSLSIRRELKRNNQQYARRLQAKRTRNHDQSEQSTYAQPPQSRGLRRIRSVVFTTESPTSLEHIIRYILFNILHRSYQYTDTNIFNLPSPVLLNPQSKYGRFRCAEKSSLGIFWALV